MAASFRFISAFGDSTSPLLKQSSMIAVLSGIWVCRAVNLSLSDLKDGLNALASGFRSDVLCTELEGCWSLKIKSSCVMSLFRWRSTKIGGVVCRSCPLVNDRIECRTEILLDSSSLLRLWGEEVRRIPWFSGRENCWQPNKI